MSVHAFSRYPDYRESQCEWLGAIPAHWSLRPVKHLCSISGGVTPAKDNRRYWDGGTIPWVSPKDMKVLRLSETQDHITEAAVEESSLSCVAPGSLLMVVRSGILQRTIPVAINSVSVTLNQDMRALTFLGPQGAEYFAYLVQGHVSALLQRWTKQGATVESVEYEFLANDSVPDVPSDERVAIVMFLDYETAKIDALIEKQQQLIALLKEKRQAVISHAVTKGLNPDAPMRDSGVEWLGEVPAHWEVAPIKHVFENLDYRRIPLSTSERGERQGEYDYYGASGVIDHIDDYLFDEPAILVGEDGANLVNRSTPLAFPAFGKYWVNNHAHILRPPDQAIRFWAEAIEHIDVNPLVSGAAQPKLTAEALMNLKVAFPPELEVRLAIEEFVTLRDGKMAELQAHAAAQVQLLQERRTALISAAVTGKIDVRGWNAPNAAIEEVIA